MLQNSIQNIISSNEGPNPGYLRNLIKEELQNYILQFVYTSPQYNTLLFTGGTCLRKVYGINRLSEDLDFDYENSIDIQTFAQEIVTYFKTKIQYPNIQYSIAGNGNTIYLKLPILKELQNYSQGTPEDIFVRCDLSKESKGSYLTDKNMITAGQFQFFVISYDLSTMFANKFIAFLERSLFKGSQQKLPFKGRDIYDLFWLIQLSAKSSFSLKMNRQRVQSLSIEKDIDKLKDQFSQKLKLVDQKFVYDDLFPLIGSGELLNNFIQSYQDYLLKYIDMVLQ